MTISPALAQESTPTPRQVFLVLRWLHVVHSWSSEIPDVDPALVLAIIQAESQGLQDAESTDGYASIGLMQIIPRSWTASPSCLRQPKCNVYWGMYLFDSAINKYGDERLALAHYNCSEEGVATDGCGDHGGLNYADKILERLVPIYELELDKLVMGTSEHERNIQVRYAWYPEMIEWLKAWGYGVDPTPTPRPRVTPPPTEQPTPETTATATPRPRDHVADRVGSANSQEEINMEGLPVLALAGVPIIVIVFAIVEEIKAYGVTGKILRVVSLVVGCILAVMASLAAGLPTDSAGWISLVVVGLLYGLTASGAYDFLDGRIRRV